MFIDGCFWHACPEHGSSPRSNHRFWEEKLSRNRERDRETDTALTLAGWTVLRFWEHESAESVAEQIIGIVAARRTGQLLGGQ